MPLSTVDWPDQLAAVVFARGCPWNCPYCHNPHLLGSAADENDVEWNEVTTFLETRRGLLDGVVFSGGEPTAQVGLAEAMREVRAMGFSCALHTGGPAPDRLAEVLPLVDWIGFDVKAPFAEYARVTGVAGSGEKALESLRALVASGVAFEARTTVHLQLLDADALTHMASELRREGVTRWVLQPYRSDGARTGLLEGPAFVESELPVGLGEGFESFSIRR